MAAEMKNVHPRLRLGKRAAVEKWEEKGKSDQLERVRENREICITTSPEKRGIREEIGEGRVPDITYVPGLENSRLWFAKRAIEKKKKEKRRS